MDIENLQVIVTVAKVGSFAEAARQLDRDPSQISRSVASIEQQLQVQLFKRSTRSLSLTEAGQRYLARLEPLLEELGDAQDEARQFNQQPTGKLRITASNAFAQMCLLPLVKEFCETYPDIELDLVLSDSNIDLTKENIDLACRLTPSFDSDLIGVKLFDTAYRVVASPRYLAQCPTLGHPKDLSEHKSVVFSLPSFRSRWWFKQAPNPSLEVKIKPRILSSSAMALRDMLLQGMGPGLAANWLIGDDLARGDVMDVFPDWQVTATDFETAAWLLYPSRRFLPVKTRLMIDYLKSKLANKYTVKR